MTRARLSGHATDLGEARQRALEFAVAAGRVAHGDILAVCLIANCLMVFAFRRPDASLGSAAVLRSPRGLLVPAGSSRLGARRLGIGEAEAQRHAVARCRSRPVPLPEGSARAAATHPLPRRLPPDTDAWRRRVRLTWRLCLALPLVALVLHGPKAGEDGVQVPPGYVLWPLALTTVAVLAIAMCQRSGRKGWVQTAGWTP